MNKNLLKKLIKEILVEVTEADMKKLRRAVILAIFTSNIPNEIKRDLNASSSGAPDADVRKVTKVFLDQVVKDEEDLLASPEYQELKQDPEFLKLAKVVVDILNRNNKAGLLDMSNIGFTTSDITKPFSYSILLYHAVEREAATLLSYLTTKYGDKFSKELYKMLPRQSKPAIRPTRENLDELSGAEARNEVNLDYTAEKVDSRIGTNLAFKNYVFPAGYPEDRVKEIILNGNDDDKLNAFNTLITVNTKLKTISGIQRLTDIDDIVYILSCMVKHVPPEDIKFYVERFIPIENSAKARSYEKAFQSIQEKFDIGIGWLPSEQNAMEILNAINRKNDMIG
jgi:hypothetical protein